MACNGLKVLTYAYKDLTQEAYDELMVGVDGDGEKIENYVETPECRGKFEEGLTYVATFGLEDPLRDSVEESINLIRYGYH
jgi:magnesium-transporting ATPase (P-type)